ncbi:hypothetical protein [Nocardia sp. NPDC005825]|uniref:hypothetical protein n=1 Tax=unclassified Nocardia TaxID=2637762 RepID=UPI0033EB5DC2
MRELLGNRQDDMARMCGRERPTAKRARLVDISTANRTDSAHRVWDIVTAQQFWSNGFLRIEYLSPFAAIEFAGRDTSITSASDPLHARHRVKDY